MEGEGENKIQDIETHESKATREGESAQRNVVKMRSREEICPSKQPPSFGLGQNSATIKRVGHGWVRAFHFETRTIKVFLSLWDKHATMPLVCSHVFLCLEFYFLPPPAINFSSMFISWCSSLHVHCLLVFTPFAALRNAHLIHYNPPPPIYSLYGSPAPL